MKVKVSVTLSKDLLEAVDVMSASYKSRSAFIEFVLRKATSQMIRQQQDARDMEIINQHIEELNAEAEDVFRFFT